MEIRERPKLTLLGVGETNKIFQVDGSAGTKMPIHTCTHEAVIMVQEGEVLLQMPDNEVVLKKGDTQIVPAQKEHALKIIKTFKGLAVMAVNAQINFI